MAFTSIGYDGSVNERQWAELVSSVGSSTYGVKGEGDLKVSAVPGQPLMVSVAAGAGWGHGVLDTEASNTTITCDPITSGVRWDLIALRRDWQPLAGGPTAVAKVTGTSDKVIPGSRKNQPGVIDDQPLALVQWTAGQTQPTAIVDLRCWAGNGGMVAVDDLALTYLTALGTRVTVKNTDWLRRVGDNDSPELVKLATRIYPDTPWADVPLAQGFKYWTSNGWFGLKYCVRGGIVYLNGAVTRPDSWPSITCAVMPTALKPAVKIQGIGVEVEPTVGNIVIPPGATVASLSASWPLFS